MLAAATAFLLIEAPPAFADPNGFNGAYEDDVPIVLPPYHGLDPKISLHYNSSSGNGAANADEVPLADRQANDSETHPANRAMKRDRSSGRDVQIATADAEITRDAFVGAGNKSVTYKIYPELNNQFAISKSGSVADYFDPRAEVSPAFLEDVADFVNKATVLTRTTTAAQAQSPRALR